MEWNVVCFVCLSVCLSVSFFWDIYLPLTLSVSMSIYLSCVMNIWKGGAKITPVLSQPTLSCSAEYIIRQSQSNQSNLINPTISDFYSNSFFLFLSLELAK
ncbi:hypothetical protein DFA_08628 [Cavenderia fasciculata]|uniref:Uncharacterized protein n=1 Tax=Cavenderia fasciculata TaxID=261658 RepID=F4Q3C2_CACFS|nr:uncharacterized protein DFA_08628 [Cavenderia fasciculata]EGG17632.1 hypothetical protein DFA_08628 [Cavenderia fasciculata]|eukprot:XP_004356116.1 hypothetical protein DFA_08628 [Cavenderia fasciculata]